MPIIDESRQLLGTNVRIKLVMDEFLAAARNSVDAAFDECERIEKQFSRFIGENQLAALNARVGQWVEVSEELYALLEKGEEVKRSTNGAFDLSVKSILEGWGYDAGYSLTEHFEGKTGEIEFQESKVRIHSEVDLGGLGKGYALDQMARLLRGFDNFMIDAGGDIYAQGHDEGGPWRIIFEHPEDTSKGIGAIDVDGMALACSSPSRRKWRDKHHLVDPHKKAPADEMQAVYTQAQTGLLADAYSTALFVLGFDEAKKTLPNLPIEAMLVGPKGDAYLSEGFKGELF